MLKILSNNNKIAISIYPPKTLLLYNTIILHIYSQFPLNFIKYFFNFTF
nr:MAG TPA: hypothetical protein [Caudoviricetes sp.]